MRRRNRSDGFHGGLLQRNGAQMHMGSSGPGLRRRLPVMARASSKRRGDALKRMEGERYELHDGAWCHQGGPVLVATGASRWGRSSGSSGACAGWQFYRGDGAAVNAATRCVLSYSAQLCDVAQHR